jgi:hypothetical protein
MKTNTYPQPFPSKASSASGRIVSDMNPDAQGPALPPEATLRRGEIHEEMHFLQISLETADSLSARLMDVLHPICSSESTRTEKDDTANPISCAFASVIQARRREVDEINRRLSSLLERLQF